MTTRHRIGVDYGQMSSEDQLALIQAINRSKPAQDWNITFEKNLDKTIREIAGKKKKSDFGSSLAFGKATMTKEELAASKYTEKGYRRK